MSGSPMSLDSPLHECVECLSCQSELSIKLDLSCDWDYFKLIVCRPSDNTYV